jgi:hypothetical protein
LSGTDFYHIEIKETANNTEPSEEAIAFISQIQLGDGTGSPPVAETIMPAATSREPSPKSTPQNHTTSSISPAETEAGTGHMQPAPTQQAKSSGQPDTGHKTPGTLQNDNIFSPPQLDLCTPEIDTGTIPLVKFSATDPCDPKNNEDGMPWEKSVSGSHIILPKGVTPIVPPVIPELKNLSQFNYNAAVSVAFEGMRLIYGPLPNDDAKKFEAAWAPLFDYPTQEIIDYLNWLN